MKSKSAALAHLREVEGLIERLNGRLNRDARMVFTIEEVKALNDCSMEFRFGEFCGSVSSLKEKVSLFIGEIENEK